MNVIPPEVTMTGTIRTFDRDTRELVMAHFDEVVCSVCRAFGASAEVDLTLLTPAVINDSGVCDVVRSAVVNVLGEQALSSGTRTRHLNGSEAPSNPLASSHPTV